MTGVAVTGWGALTSAGVGSAALVERLAGTDLSAAAEPDLGGTVGELTDEPLPARTGHALTGFDVRAHLGRKGTSTYDRATALAVVCCQDALRSAGTTIDDTTRARVGVVLGTTIGSFKSTSDFSRETIVNDRPYMVNPLVFPNAVMNYAAGQISIRFGLRGVNATVAGGELAFFNALRYAVSALRRGHADVMLATAVEEFSAHRAWAGYLTGEQAIPTGEAAGTFVLTSQSASEWAGPRRLAHVLAVATGFGPGGGEGAGLALSDCVDRAVRRSGVDPALVTAVCTGEADGADRREYDPAARALGHRPKRVMIKRLFGDCGAASGAVAMASVLATAEEGVVLLTARDTDGGVGCALVQGGQMSCPC